MSTVEEIKKLRDATGAGINAVREALKESKGDYDKAIKYLREKGVAKAEKRAGNEALNGVLGVYIHGNNSMVSVVEVLCETDFAAKSEDLKKFANDIALHVAASNPEFINEDSVSEEKVQELKDTAKKDLEGKPENVKENIMGGKLKKYYQEAVLLNQQFFSDDSKTVQDYLNEVVAKIGEKIVINSFTVFKVAQDINVCSLKKEDK